MTDFPGAEAAEAVRLALAEDLGAPPRDITSDALIPAEARAEAVFLAREGGVLAGLPLVQLVFRQVDPAIELDPLLTDGTPFAAGTALARARGSARALLRGERVALNFLQRLSGVATMARRFVEAVAGTAAGVYDTRKTTPGLRALEKYAVRCGGGRNHRMGLYDQGLVKDNHLAALARGAGRRPDEVDIAQAAAAIRRLRPGAFVEIEAATLRGVERALEAAPDAILLDNMSPEEMRRAVALVRERTAPGSGAKRPALEASGGVRLETVRAIAETGVDRISVGALTHSARALDIALEFELT